ncbi:GH23361 [Drosophila grimshawi]|uniref:GH23361 n=1 Tax=Drosophila grimshawi TaxID=7222 RepID=B4K368_DROGR|nr:GH23361 [Drosophila grimshawi]
MSSECLWFRSVLRVVASVHLGYALYYEYRFTQLAVQLRLDPAICGKFKYLTFLNELLQFVYNLLALCQDIRQQRAVRKLRDYLLASCVVPLALTMAVTYWTLCVINRETIYPEFLDLIYPKWLNQTQHS